LRTNADQQWSIPTHRKTDKGKEVSFLTLIRLPDKTICPVEYFEELLKRHFQSHLPLFHWDNGRELTSVTSIYACVAKLLWEAGIPKEYKCYSIRHATITKLYMAGNDSVRVNTFSGHSERSNTSSKYYCHQVGKWLGFDLAAAPAETTPIVPQLVDKHTPKVRQTQSDNEQNNSEDEDIDESEVEKQEPVQA
jgi:integrase